MRPAVCPSPPARGSSSIEVADAASNATATLGAHVAIHSATSASARASSAPAPAPDQASRSRHSCALPACASAAARNRPHPAPTIGAAASAGCAAHTRARLASIARNCSRRHSSAKRRHSASLASVASRPIMRARRARLAGFVFGPLSALGCWSCGAQSSSVRPIDVRARREPFVHHARRLAAKRDAMRDAAQRRAHHALIHEFTAHEPVGVVRSARRDPAFDDRNDVGGGAADVDEQRIGDARRDPLRARVPVRRRHLAPAVGAGGAGEPARRARDRTACAARAAAPARSRARARLRHDRRTGRPSRPSS